MQGPKKVLVHEKKQSRSRNISKLINGIGAGVFFIVFAIVSTIRGRFLFGGITIGGGHSLHHDTNGATDITSQSAPALFWASVALMFLVGAGAILWALKPVRRNEN